MKKLIEKIFSVKNEKDHKICRLLGFKISFKNHYFYQKLILDKLNLLDEKINTLDIRFYENKIRQQKMFSVYSLHQQVFPQFKNKHLGNDIAIVGCGPTLNYYEPIKNTISIALNRALDYKNIDFSYHFWVDYWDDSKEWLKKFSNKKCIRFYGQYINFIPEPDIFINGKYRGCQNIPDIDAIRDNAFRFYSNNGENHIYQDISTAPLMDYCSIAHCAFQFALWTHPERIFLVGCDTENNGYYNGLKQNEMPLSIQKQGYVELAKFSKVYYPDIEIISINPVGLKGLFKDVYTQSYVDAHPELKEENIEIINEEGLCKNL